MVGCDPARQRGSDGAAVADGGRRALGCVGSGGIMTDELVVGGGMGGDGGA